MRTLLTKDFGGGYSLGLKTRAFRVRFFHFATLEEAQRWERLFLRISGR